MITKEFYFFFISQLSNSCSLQNKGDRQKMASEPVPEWTSISDPALAQRLQKIAAAFRKKYGADPELFARAPGEPRYWLHGRVPTAAVLRARPGATRALHDLLRAAACMQRRCLSRRRRDVHTSALSLSLSHASHI